MAGVHTMSGTDLRRTRTNPHDVRRKNFSVRFRGVDPGEVRSFLTGLADELEGIQTQVAVLTQENQSLRAQVEEVRTDLEEAHADPRELATDQAVSVLNQAQQLADSLIDEAMQSARDLLLTARSQQRDVMEQAKMAARVASPAPQPSPRTPAMRMRRSATSSTSGCSPRLRRCSSKRYSMPSMSMSATWVR